MSRSWRSFTPAHVRAFVRSPTVTDREGYQYVVQTAGGRIEQLETHAGDSRHRLARGADYLVGSGNHAIALLNADRGYLTELPIGWFSAAAAWRLNPGYELKNHRFSRPITTGCVACHATFAEPPSPDTNYFPTHILDGIDCSRCHGEATGHSDFWKRSGNGEPPAAAQFVHPGRLPTALVNDICFQCHLQGDVPLYRLGHSPFDFHPGQRLLDLRQDFLISGQRQTLGVASHGARMLQSLCYEASGGRLTCINCHDAHQPAASLPREVYDRACAECHQSEACSRPETATNKNHRSCVACHMPQRATREGIHLVFTDHAIPRQPLPEVEASPPLLPPNSNAELLSAWPHASPDDAALGAGHVLLHETMGPQVLALERACFLLEKAVQKNPEDVESRYWLGSAWLARGKPAEALSQLRIAVDQQPKNHQARFRLALAQEAVGDIYAATAEYERLLKESPQWLEPYPRLAQLYLSRQRPADSARVLQAQVARQPSAAAYAALALAERLAGKSHSQSLATLEQAIQVDSRSPAAYITSGTLWLLAGESDRALAEYQAALQLDPSNHIAQEAIRSLEGTR